MRYKTTNILRLANTVRQNIQIEKLVNSNNLLISFSGGQDSAFCLLVLYLLNNKMRKQLNCQKVLDLSDHFNKKNALIKQTFNSNLSLSSCEHGKQNMFDLSQTRALFLSTTRFPFNVKEKKYVFFKEEKTNDNQIARLIDNYTLLWCNHFWQKDTFFTMEHVFKLSFSKDYTMHSFAPVKKILSEQNARHWRHKVMQRLSLFILKPNYHFVELYFHYVFITTPFLFTKSRKQSYVLYKTKFCECIQLCVQGHNKSDRAEAILFNLMRGTGMNGLSTLQWKHTFSPPSNSNSKFYPIFSDFLKEIQIIYLQKSFFKKRFNTFKKQSFFKNSFFIKVSRLQKDKIQTNRSAFAVNQNLILPKILLDRYLNIKTNKSKVTKSLYKPHTLFLTKQRTNSVFVQPDSFVRRNINEVIKPNLKKKANLNKSKLMLFSQNPMVNTKQSYNKTRLFAVNKANENFFMPSQKSKPFYYQLKYNTKI